MKLYVPGVFLLLFLWLVSGCSAPVVMEKAGTEAVEEQNGAVSTFAEADSSSSIQKYEQEKALLAQILAYYEKILVAHREGDFGLAETLIDSAFVMYGKVNVDEVTDQALVLRFTSVSSSLAREYGLILMESDQIAQEDPESWIPDLSDAEQFKSGQWSDEELKTIVNKISRKCDVPIDFNPKVRNSIYYFQNQGRKFMTNWLRKSGRYFPMMQNTFAEEGLPGDLACLSMIESGLNPLAVSPARCVGLWQFFYATGKLYGLERNEWYDERRDPVKSTKAAAQHLKDLYKMYDDWNLVLAAYNCGAGRVTRSIKSGGIEDYWRMDLPKETDNYVPTFMAALIISKAPEIFGFENIEKESPLEFETASVRACTSLKEAARCAGIDCEELKFLNSELVRDCTPAGMDSYPLRLPKGKSEQFVAEYSKLPVEQMTASSQTDRSGATYHKVRKGDTLAKVARQYGVSISDLMKANRLKKTSRLKSGQKLVIPGGEELLASAERVSESPRTSDRTSDRTAKSTVSHKSDLPEGVSGGTTKYTVKREDTLWSLANRYNTTVDALVAINNLSDNSAIVAGQTILVPKGAESPAPEKAQDDRVTAKKSVRESDDRETAKKTSRNEASSDTITYIMKKNDSLYEIATKYGVSYKDIMLWNKIKDHRKVKAGTRLVIKTKG